MERPRFISCMSCVRVCITGTQKIPMTQKLDSFFIKGNFTCFTASNVSQIWKPPSGCTVEDLPSVYRSFDDAINLDLFNRARIVDGEVKDVEVQSRYRKHETWSLGDLRRRQGRPSFIFVLFSAKNVQNNSTLGLPPPGKSWIHHCWLVLNVITLGLYVL